MKMCCPICGEEIKENEDRLIVEFYVPKQWWITRHLKRKGEDRNPEKYGEWGITCAVANMHNVHEDKA